ncbi:PTS sugar transporter subunit IIB [Microbacterium sp. NPDC091313]
MRILVVCGAGASSTFVAQRVRRAAQAKGLPYTAVAGTVSSLEVDLDSADILLIGPHLMGDRERIELIARAREVATVVLPEDVFADMTGERTLSLVTASAATPETTP